MEKPNALTTAWFDGLIPKDPRAVRGQMFGHPCALVNGNMFFGTFAQTLVVRLGEARAAAVVTEVVRIFAPPRGGAWKEYVQIVPDTVPDTLVAAYAQEAFERAAVLPPKVKKEKAPAVKKVAKAK